MCKIFGRLYLFPNAEYMQKICARLYFSLQCTIYAQDLHKIVLLSPMHNICSIFARDCTSFSNIYICTRFAKDCTSFSNVQYMCKIFARLYLLPQCAIYAQDLCKIVLLSLMCNICTRFAQDCTSFPNAQYMD